MRKQYTTTELINKLDIGQKAEMIAPVTDIIVQRKDTGIIVLKDLYSNKHLGAPMPLSPTVLNATWVVVPRHISFEEAVMYIRKGQVVSCEYDGRPPVRYDSLEDLVHFYEIVEGNWYLED